MDLDYESLKKRHREVRETHPPALALRTHRALSWLNRSEMELERGDEDARFLFLWISFNAAYANEITDRRAYPERRLLLMFLNRLVDSDSEKLLYGIVWKRYPNSIRLLIDNKYVFQPFWDFQNGNMTESAWEEKFHLSKRAAHRALGHMNTKKVLAIAFERLYTLRNQLIHGGATWNSSVNRSQVKDGASILGDLVPVIIHLMMEKPDQLWGDPCYPVVD